MTSPDHIRTLRTQCRQHANEALDIAVGDVAEDPAHDKQIGRGANVIRASSCVRAYGLDAMKLLSLRSRPRSFDEAWFELDQPTDHLLAVPPPSEHGNDIPAVSGTDA